MNLPKKKSMFLLLSALLISVVSMSSFSQEERASKKGRKGPPEAALSACQGLQVEQACTFISPRRGEVSGTCVIPKNGESTLACKPERKPRT